MVELKKEDSKFERWQQLVNIFGNIKRTVAQAILEKQLQNSTWEKQAGRMGAINWVKRIQRRQRSKY
jgi:hypothetical protein